MFYSVCIPKGGSAYPQESLLHLLDKTFEFTPGVNVLIGPISQKALRKLKVKN